MSNNTIIYGPDVVSPTGEILQSPFYHYLVSKPACIFYLVAFGISTALHFGQSVWYRMWWLIPTVVLCGAGELIGWGGRLWSAISPLENNPFLIQIVCTIIAPTPFLAAIFMTFARLTKRLGVQYSRLSPRLYSRIFLTCDIISLIVQAAGGGLAASANDDAGSNLGANIMLGGIIFQLVSLIFSEWDTRIKVLVGGLTFICVCIFIRSVYRLIELADGWSGKVISTQVYFNALDGAMIWIAMLTYNVCHPGLLLGTPSRPFHQENIAMESGFLPSSETLLERRS
ncbi:unnamed protein product [Somion occarium]|uniref:RTA1-domain-containing protein n=1 Tax=Somion occarium TaxID=3059160 RepID=A0ABP1E9M7_9APHY